MELAVQLRDGHPKVAARRRSLLPTGDYEHLQGSLPVCKILYFCSSEIKGFFSFNFLNSFSCGLDCLLYMFNDLYCLESFTKIFNEV